MPTRSPLRHQVVHGHEPADLEGGKAEEQDDSPSEAARQYSIDERPQDRTCKSKQDDEFNPPGVRHGGILLHDRVRRGRAPPRAGPLTGDRDASACLGWPRSRSDVRDGRDSARESNAIATNRPSGARVGAADAGREGCQVAVNGEGSSDPRLVVTIGTVTALLQDGVIDTGHRAAPPLAGPGPHAIGVAAREGPRLAGQPVHGPDLRDLLAPGAERVRAVAGAQARMIDRACDRTEPTPRPVRYRSRCRTYRPVRPGSLLAQPSSRNRSRTSLRTSLLTGWIPVETGTPNSV